MSDEQRYVNVKRPQKGCCARSAVLSLISISRVGARVVGGQDVRARVRTMKAGHFGYGDQIQRVRLYALKMEMDRMCSCTYRVQILG